ncbi:MAG: hypothetical protein AAFX06_22600 [Planctomycetota bacterium]
MADTNPFRPPNTVPESPVDEYVGPELPKDLLRQTRWVVRTFGIFNFLWPIAVSPLTDSLPIDLLALVIAGNAIAIHRRSFQGFPWTAVLCSFYAIGFPVILLTFDATNLSLWLPTRFSPVLSLQLVSSAGAIASISMIVRCHRFHRSAKQAAGQSTA